MAVSTPDEGAQGHTEAPVSYLEAQERCQQAMYRLGREVADAMPKLTEIMRRLGEAMAEGFEQLAAADERFREVLRNAREGSDAKPAP